MVQFGPGIAELRLAPCNHDWRIAPCHELRLKPFLLLLGRRIIDTRLTTAVSPKVRLLMVQFGPVIAELRLAPCDHDWRIAPCHELRFEPFLLLLCRRIIGTRLTTAISPQVRL
jgi:hypothetical protein